VVFAIATILAGASQDMPMLIAARAIQGTGAALMMPTAVAPCRPVGDNWSMAATRREFLRAGASAAAALSLGPQAFAETGARPNVLLLVIDTLRADHVGAYGGRAQTPNIDALARQGLRFTRFYPEAMATVPARRSILTGRRVWPFRGWHFWPELGGVQGWEPIRDLDTTFTSQLRRAGYWTGYVTDNPFLTSTSPYSSFRASFDSFVGFSGQWGFGPPSPPTPASTRRLHHWLIPELRKPDIEAGVDRFLAASGEYWKDESHSWAARVYTASAQALDVAAAHQPFALVADTFEPHEPWTPPRSYIDLYGDARYRGPEPSTSLYARVSEWLSRERAGPVLARMRDLYAAEVTLTDRWLGVLLGRLRELGLDGNTVIALVADHGYLLGEHGWTGKIASMLHPPLIHVPFILVDPARRRAGETSDYLAQTHDIGPTLLAMAGVSPPHGMDGVDLSELLAGGRPPVRSLAYGGYGNWHYARNSSWSFVSLNNGRGRRLYDLTEDPLERRNLARHHPRLIDEFYRRVVRLAHGRPPLY
jgi:arylsulfatase A-like enzyme